MDFKQYLLEQKDFNLSSLAVKMWPSNQHAVTYLSKKLRGKNDRKFTEHDEQLARKALEELGVKLIEESKNHTV